MANSKKPPSHQKRKIKRADLFLEEKKSKHVSAPNSVDVSNPPLRSAPQSLSPHNKGGIERYKRSKIRNSALKLDDTCVLPLLRTSFVQDYLGGLKTGTRKLVSIRNIRKSAVRNFATVSYKKRMVSSDVGCRRSNRNLSDSTIDLSDDVGEDVIRDFGICDLSYRHIRRYIIEDIMYLDPSDKITIVVNVSCDDYTFWSGISTQQQFNLPLIQIGDDDYLQIPSVVRSNNRKGEFTSGQHDNDSVLYLVVGNGGAGVTIDFYQIL